MNFILLSVKNSSKKVVMDEIKAMILDEFVKEKLIKFDAVKKEIEIISDSPIIKKAIFS